MLKSAKIGKEIVITVVNKIGVLADISEILASRGINIVSVAGYAKDNKRDAEVMLVTTVNFRAIAALKKNSYKSIKEREVIVVELENKPGALKEITGKLSEAEIDIEYIYGTTSSGKQPGRIILITSNNKKALAAFKR